MLLVLLPIQIPRETDVAYASWALVKDDKDVKLWCIFRYS